MSNWNGKKKKNMDLMFNGTPLETNPPKWYKE